MGTFFLGFVGYSGSGKTTLIEKLITEFSKERYKVGTVKHDAHSFEIDYPGKDSYRFKHAGSIRVVLSSKDKLALIEDREEEKPFSEIKAYFLDCDLVFVEGYKLEDLPKIEVHRKITNHDYLFKKSIENIIMIAADEEIAADVPTYNINDIEGIYEFIKERMV